MSWRFRGAVLVFVCAWLAGHAGFAAAGDRAPVTGGQWSSRTQLVLDGRSRRLIRMALKVWDAHPDRDLEFYWEPTRGADLPPDGAVSGWGTLTWRERGTPRYADEGLYSTYKGEMRNGRRHGVGRLQRRDGLVYEGEWAEGLFDGQGAVTWPNGDQFEGGFRRGVAHGTGRFASASGEIYIGAFHNGRRHGRGELILPDGRGYSATWSDGVAAGRQGAQWKPFANEGETVNLRAISVGVMPAPNQELAYKVTREGIVIEPDAKVLKLLAGGGVIKAYDDAPLGRRAVDLYVQVANKNADAVHVTGIYLNVEESVEDRRPLLVIGGQDVCTGGQPGGRMTLRNQGWAALENVRFELSFGDRSGKRVGPVFERKLGRVGAEPVTFDFEDALAKMGVKVGALSKSFQCGSHSGGAASCLASARKTGNFGRLSRVVLGGDVGALYDFVHVPVVGRVSYDWADQSGKMQRGTTRYELMMHLQHMFYGAHECGEVVPYDPAPRRRPVAMRLGSRDYQLNGGLNRKVRVGKQRRFVVKLRPGKSSRHRFRALVQFSDGSQKFSPWVTFNYYRANKPAGEQ